MRVRMMLALALLLATGGTSSAADRAQGDHRRHMGAAKASVCAEASLRCADKATPFFASDGSLWLAWSGNGRVAVQRSTDLGRSFSAPVFVNGREEKLDAGADTRPQIVKDKTGRIVVAYTVARGAHYDGEVLVAQSDSTATSFEIPRPLTRDGASQRFVSFALDPDGRVFAAWIDKRNLAAAKRAGEKYDGAALAFAWKQDANFAVTHIAQDNTCECCRIGVAFNGSGQPVVLWRNMFEGGVRDHAIMTLTERAPGPVYRVAVDDWKIDACPHQGPSLAIGENGTYHATWFTEGRVRQGLFYAWSHDGGRNFAAPLSIGNQERQPSRPFVLASAGRVWLVWKEFDGTKSVVNAMVSRDDGVTWSKERTIAETANASDHPLLIAQGPNVFLSWLTEKEDYRLISLETVR